MRRALSRFTGKGNEGDPAGRRQVLPPGFHTLGLILLGVLPFALFALLASTGSDLEPEDPEGQQPGEASMSTATVPLAFPFGEPPAPEEPALVEELPSPEPVVPASPKQCSNGRDDDRDGKTDYPADPGCSSRNDSSESPNPAPKPATPPPTASAAAVAPAASPPTTSSPRKRSPIACDNGIDDDGDRKIDLADPGCRSKLDLNEADPPPRKLPTPGPTATGGSGDGTGEGNGSGTGEGNGSGTGEGDGSGTGEGDGSGTGEGDGSENTGGPSESGSPPA